MDNKIRNVLLKIEKSGYKAYVVGGFVRDYLLGNKSYDVDICTNARPNEIIEIFDLSHQNNYGGLHFKDSTYNYDITTFRKETKYENRKPVEFTYVDSIDEDIIRRDFTINSLYMDSNGNIIDKLNGLDDLKNKIIRNVGNVRDKMVEDPLRMLRAVRFASLLDFKIDDNILTFIKQNKYLILTLSYTRRENELNYIFENNNKLNGIKLIKELSLCDVLDIKINKEIKYSSSYLGIWAQIDFSDKYQFSNNKINIISNIRRILDYEFIDNIVLYKYGLYSSMIAGEILGISNSYISALYKDLPIYSRRDIKIHGDEIASLLNIKDNKNISSIIEDIELSILDNKLNNNYNELCKYVIDYWR